MNLKHINIVSAIAFIAISSLCGCRSKDELFLRAAYPCDKYNYRGDLMKYEDLKLPNGALHYYVVDTIELANPVVVFFDLNTQFIMEETVFNRIKPSYENYIDNDYVYIFTGDNAPWIRSIYPEEDTKTKKYTSRINFYVPEKWSSNKTLNPDIIDKSKYGMRICRWSSPPHKFVLMLIRGSSYRTNMCCLTDFEYGSGDIIARHLPLKTTTPYYKMLHPLFE